MKIVVTGTRGIPDIQGGVETHCEELYPRIADKDHTIIIVRRPLYKPEKESSGQYKNITIKDITTPRMKHFEAFMHTFKAVIYAKTVGADIVHIHAIGPALMTPLVKLMGMKAVVTHHGPDYERKKWGAFSKKILKIGEKMGAKYADHMIVISNHIKSHLLHTYPPIKAVSLIHNGVELSTSADEGFINEWGLTSQRYILAVGRFVEEKGFDLLIEAFKAAHLEDVKLVIAGDADHTDQYAERLKRLAKENKVVLTGFVGKSQLKQLYTKAQLFVLPSYHEGLPIALLEAMNCNCKVLVSDIPANKEVGLPSDDYFKCGDKDDLTVRIKEKLTKLSDQPPIYDMQKYNWDYIACQTKEVYDALMKKAERDIQL